MKTLIIISKKKKKKKKKKKNDIHLYLYIYKSLIKHKIKNEILKKRFNSICDIKVQSIFDKISQKYFHILLSISTFLLFSILLVIFLIKLN